MSHSRAEMSTGYMRISLSSGLAKTSTSTTDIYKHTYVTECHTWIWPPLHLRAQMFHCFAIVIDDLLFVVGVSSDAFQLIPNKMADGKNKMRENCCALKDLGV